MGGVKLSISDIIFNTSFKKPSILQYHSKHLPKLTSVKITYILPAYTDYTAIYVIKTHKQLYHCCLSGPSRTYNGNFLPRLHLCAEIVNNCVIRIITKLYMFKFHASLKSFHRYGVFHCLLFLRFL